MNEELPNNPLEKENLLQRLEIVESMLQEQTQRLYHVEEKLGLAQKYQAPTAPPVIEPVVAPPIVEAPKTPPPPHSSFPPPPITQQPPPQVLKTPVPAPNFAPRPSRPSLPQINLEALIGGNWFNRIGMLAIVIGMGFFLKLAFEREWIGPAGRILIGVLIGSGLIVGCEKMRGKGYKHYAHGLAGGGIAILYLTFFAAFARYHLIPQMLAFALMALVTTASVLLAVRYDAIAIAILGLIGGFLTPLMLSTGVDNQVGLFGYIVLLDLGVLVVAYFKKWRVLNYLAYGATVAMSAAWMMEWYRPEKLWTTMFFFMVLFVIFALLAVLYNIINRMPIAYPEISLIFSNALLYFGTSYGLLNGRYDAYLGLFAVVVSAFYLGLGYFAFSRDRSDKMLILTFVGLASLFLTIAVPIQFDQHWVTMAWAIEGVILTWIGLKAENRTTYRAAVIVFTIAAVHWVMFDVKDFSYQSLSEKNFLPLLNRRALSAGVLIAGLIAATKLHFARRKENPESTQLVAVFLAAANVLTLALLTIDISDYFQQKKIEIDYTQGVFDESIFLINDRIEESAQLALILMWTLYGAIATGFGIIRKIKWVRYGGFALLAFTGMSLFANNAKYFNSSWHSFLANKMFVAFVAFIAALFVTRWLLKRAESIDEAEKTIVYNVLTVTANGFALIALTTEALGYFSYGRNLDTEFTDLNLAARLSLSVIWALYGGGMLVVGLIRSSKLLRLMGLILLAVTTVKVFLIDLSSLDKVYRIISFIVLGGILLGVSFLYQRFQRNLQRSEKLTAESAADAERRTTE